MRAAVLAACSLILIAVTAGDDALAQRPALDGASPRELIEVLKANVLLSGDVVTRLAAQERLERLGSRDPQAVVPLVVAELAPPRAYGKRAGHQRLALIELLRDIGPAAEAAVPVLVEILNDAEEPYDTVRTQAAAALERIGTVEARAAAKAYYSGLQQQFARQAPAAQISQSVAQSAFLIRQELRRAEPSDGVIAASVDALSALGAGAAPAIPTLLRAYGDRRLGAALHAALGEALRAAGATDVEARAERAAARRGVPDLLREVIEETEHRDPHVRSLAMIELARLGPSQPAVEAMTAALGAGRNPGDAARVLGEFGAPAAPALPAIVRYFDDESAGANAIQAAGKIGVKDPAIVAALRRVLATPGHRHRGQAAHTLGALAATEALPELERALADGRKYERILSAQAIGRLGPAGAPAVASLSGALDDPDLDLRRAAVAALGDIGEAAMPATAALTAQLDSGDARLKAAARDALARIGGPQADTALRRDASRFADADLAEMRRLASTGGIEDMSRHLHRLPERRASALAHRLLSESEPDLAFVGARYLARRGDVEPAIPVLADHLARRPDAEDVFTGLLYSMLHGGDEKTHARALLEGLRRYAAQNRDRYGPEERARLEALLERGTGRR